MKNAVRELAGLKLTRVLLLSVVLLVLANRACYLLDLNYWQPKSRNDMRNIYAYKHSDEQYDVVFLGSSRIRRGILSSVIEDELEKSCGGARVFNLGQRGAHILTSYIVLRDILAEPRKPRIAVVELSVTNLNFHNTDREKALQYYCSQGDIIRFLPTLRTGDEVRSSLLGMFRGLTSLISFFIDSPYLPEQAKTTEAILAHGGGHLYTPAEDPFFSYVSYTEEEQEQKKAKKLKRFRKKRLQLYEIGDQSDRLVNEMRALSKKNGTRLIFINMPMTEEFLNIFSGGEYATYMKYLEDLRKRDGVEFHDLNEAWPLLTERDFLDPHHLNESGGAKLSRYIAQDILRPYLAPEVAKSSDRRATVQ